MIDIRRAAASDAAEIARLNAFFNKSIEPAEAYAARLADPHRVDHPILAMLGAQAVGLANLRLAPSVIYPQPYAELSELFVEEDQRRKGVGTALLRFVEQIAREAGARRVLILTDFYNHAAQQLYRSAGYRHYDIALAKALVDEPASE